MAKRKRLTPANPAFLESSPDAVPVLGGPMRAAPIADVARETSASAAAEELAQTLTQARESGRMVLQVALDDIVTDHLVRDRIVVQDEEMQALKDSLRARGQQTPIDLVALPDGRYGLISGWRRCAALRALQDETGEPRFATVLGLLRQTGEQADAYLAMVEENEIRVGLSYFERARIVAKSVEQGVFDTDRAALQILFQSASRAKRSKIGAFLPVVRALDGVLRFPEALGERQGVALGRVLGDAPDRGAGLRAMLQDAAPDTAEAESALIEAALVPEAPAPARSHAEPTPAPARSHDASTPAPSGPSRRVVGSGISLTADDGRIVLEGRGVDAAFRERLIAWIRKNS